MKIDADLLANEEYDDVTRRVIQAARDDLLAFCMLINPNFILAPHHRLMADKLMDIYHGRTRRLMIFIAPRSTKSLMGSQYTQAWSLGHSPSWECMAISYGGELARDHGREVRNLLQSPEYQCIFPNIKLRTDARAANRWLTEQKGAFTAAGITSGIAGRGANLAVIDDPLSEQDAMSKTRREFVNRWYPGLRQRLMPGGRIVIIQTRWHEQDLSGHLLNEAKENPAADKWDVIKIPALLDEESAILLQNARQKLIEQGYYTEDAPQIKAGESYWPPFEAHRDVDAGLRGWFTDELLNTKANETPFNWSAVYMQQPVPEEGGIIKKEWWKDWDSPRPPNCEYILQSWDTAFETSNMSDFSAVTTWGIFRDDDDNPNMILLGAQKGRWEFPELRKKARELYNFHEPDAVIVEKKASGISLIQDLYLANVPVIPYIPDKDKVARAHASTPLLTAGRIWAPLTKNWAEEVIQECASFPMAAHDDYTDTVTQAILWMKNGVWVRHPDDVDETEHISRPRRRFYG